MLTDGIRYLINEKNNGDLNVSDKGTISIFFAIEFEIQEGTDSNLRWKKLAFINSRLESRRGFHETTHMLHQETCSSERFATPMLERIFELVSANEVSLDEFFGFTVIVDSASPTTSLKPIHLHEQPGKEVCKPCSVISLFIAFYLWSLRVFLYLLPGCVSQSVQARRREGGGVIQGDSCAI